MFGEQYGGRIDNGPNPAAAACFTRGFLSRSGGNNPFMTPPGLDLTELVDRGQAVLFAWTAGYAPVAPLNQFSPRRSTRNTLWRLSCEVED